MNVRRLLASAVAGFTMFAVVGAPTPANALTVCDNPEDAGTIVGVPVTVTGVGVVTVSVGTGETWISITGGSLGDILVGVDTSPLTVCVLAPVVGHRWYGVLQHTAPGHVGVFVELIQCFPGPFCSDVLDDTGVLINTAVPLASCIRINGVEQNPLCTVPPF